MRCGEPVVEAERADDLEGPACRCLSRSATLGRKKTEPRAVEQKEEGGSGAGGAEGSPVEDDGAETRLRMLTRPLLRPAATRGAVSLCEHEQEHRQRRELAERSASRTHLGPCNRCDTMSRTAQAVRRERHAVDGPGAQRRAGAGRKVAGRLALRGEEEESALDCDVQRITQRRETRRTIATA